MKNNSASRKPNDLSDEYWASLSDKEKSLYGLIRPMARATYQVDLRLAYIEEFIAEQSEHCRSMGGSFELDPDFQRGHVWTREQQVRYIESLIRGIAPRLIIFNCPGWTRRDLVGDIPEQTFQCVDGLQRLTAVRSFMKGEFGVFGDMKVSDFKGTPFDPGRYTLQASIYEFSRRADLLQFYLDLNSGGTIHSTDELDRVRALKERAIEQMDASVPSTASGTKPRLKGTR
jgi:hypothetical protein